ncbi:hypothetical protein AVEN_125534-1 [Araneus ventricosus]|uniref:Uncharacterized protein n=1 Tax=Araneus ventricosus TaxID=182803 RepID=A0A4Y2LUP0_ARAVE|nr:hypothetical protein AVEN_125534-1 [Araneus ventricosus]
MCIQQSSKSYYSVKSSVVLSVQGSSGSASTGKEMLCSPFMLKNHSPSLAITRPPDAPQETKTAMISANQRKDLSAKQQSGLPLSSNFLAMIRLDKT